MATTRPSVRPQERGRPARHVSFSVVLPPENGNRQLKGLYPDTEGNWQVHARGGPVDGAATTVSCGYGWL